MSAATNQINRIRVPGVKRKALHQTTLEKKHSASKATSRKKHATSGIRSMSVITDRAQSSNNDPKKNSTAEQLPKPSVASTITPSPKSHSPPLSQYSASGERAPSHIDRCRDQYRSIGTSKYDSQQESRKTHSIPSHDRNLQTTGLHAPHSNRIRAGSSPVPSIRSLGWKRARLLQQKQQQRAFVRKKDNPFTLYNHDPNDSESFLDALSTQNRSKVAKSIIPPHAPRNAGGSGFHPGNTQRHWSKSLAAFRKKKASQNRELDHAMSSPFGQYQQLQQSPPRTFGNRVFLGSSCRGPFDSAPQLMPGSSNGRFPTNRLYSTNFQLPRSDSHDGKTCELYRRNQPGFNDAPFLEFEPQQQFEDQYFTSSVSQDNDCHDHFEEHFQPQYHHDQQRSYGISQHQGPYPPHDPYDMTLQDCNYGEPCAHGGQLHRVGDAHPYQSQHQGGMMRATPFLHRPTPPNEVQQGYQQPSFARKDSHFDLPGSYGDENNFLAQDLTPATPAHGVNEEDLANAFL